MEEQGIPKMSNHHLIDLFTSLRRKKGALQQRSRDRHQGIKLNFTQVGPPDNMNDQPPDRMQQEEQNLSCDQIIPDSVLSVTSYILSTQQPCMASGYCIGQHQYREHFHHYRTFYWAVLVQTKFLVYRKYRGCYTN